MFLSFIPLLSVVLLTINLLFATHNAYQEKNSAFECGFHSFLGQNRTQFSISFFIFALLFLIFDLEILLVYPYSVSSYTNEIYGLIIMLIFFLILTLGFTFELGKNALNIDTRQVFSIWNLIRRWNLIYNSVKLKLLNLFVYFLYSILFFFIYLVFSTVIVITLFNKGVIDLPYSDLVLQIYGPMHMNADPLNSYPEYLQNNNLQDMYNAKQHLFNVKRDTEARLCFNKPEHYKQIVDNLEGTFNNNIGLIQNPSRLHPFIHKGHQVDWLKDIHNQIELAKKEYIEKVEMFNQNHRILAECNHRIIAVSTRINQLGGSNN